MKLWQKVSLLSACILLAVVIVCSALLLKYAKDSILSLTTNETSARHSSLTTAFTDMTQYYLDGETNPVVKASGINYCFRRFADDTSVLMKGDETIYSSVVFDPAEHLPLTANGEVQVTEQRVVTKEIMERNVLIVGSLVTVLDDAYSIYTVEDITSTHNDIAKLTWRFAIICAVSIVIGMVLIILLVRRTSRPLIALKSITRRIAVGEYEQRADISTHDEVGELAADFNGMAEAVQSHIGKLEDTALRQQMFVGGLTHEMKTPMASMLLHTDTLLTADLSSNEARRSLMHLHEQCRWLERLSQKLLKLITLEQEIVVQPESIAELFDDVRESTEETLQKRDIPLIVKNEIDTLPIDYDLMKSLLINLIDNASKASSPGQEICLLAYDNTIEVLDRGKGIPQDELNRVTDAFYMVDRSRSKETGGSGLGLALAKRIADAHGAELIIDSKPGAGTTVRVVFKR